jgi:hemerythrin superfamily protein
MPDGIDLLLADHELVDDLFATFDQTGDATVIGQILDTLTAHDDAEHATLYPLAGHVLGDETLIEAMSAAHSAIKKQVEHLRNLEGPPLVDAVKELRKLVQRHVADEEKRLFPALRREADDAQLATLGARILDCKQRVG